MLMIPVMIIGATEMTASTANAAGSRIRRDSGTEVSFEISMVDVPLSQAGPDRWTSNRRAISSSVPAAPVVPVDIVGAARVALDAADQSLQLLRRGRQVL
jgi:hypothetical protein